MSDKTIARHILDAENHLKVCRQQPITTDDMRVELLAAINELRDALIRVSDIEAQTLVERMIEQKKVPNFDAFDDQELVDQFNQRWLCNVDHLFDALDRAYQIKEGQGLVCGSPRITGDKLIAARREYRIIEAYCRELQRRTTAAIEAGGREITGH